MIWPDSEEFFRVVLDAVPANIAVVDGAGTIVAVNQAWRAFAAANGVSPEQVGEGVNYLASCDRVVGRDADVARRAAAEIRDVIAGRLGTSRIEYPCHSADEERWFICSTTPLHVSGNPGAVVIHLETTRRRQAEQALSESEEKYRMLVEQADEVFYKTLCDGDPLVGQLKFVSQSATRITGFAVDEFVQDPSLWISLLHPEDVPAVASATRECFERLAPVVRTYRLRNRDGHYRWMEDRVSPIVDADGKAIGYQGVARDVTHYRLVEERLRDSRSSLELAQATAHLGDWRMTPHGTVVWSDEMFRLHYLDPSASGSPGRAPGLSERVNLVHPDDRERVLAIRSTLVDGRPAHLMFVYRTNPAAGPVRTLEAHVRTVVDEAGSAIEWHGTVQDVTERERQSAELRQYQKMQSVGRLAGGIAHDFNNILSEIMGFAGFVRDALDETDPRRADILCVLEAADRAAAVTRQLLAFSRQQPADKHTVDLNQQIEQFSSLLKRTVGEHIALSIEPAARPAVVLIDPVQFDQVVLNLVSNARDAMLGGGTLRISINLDAAHAYLRVTDTGVGMDSETRQRIFDPFFTTKPVGHGTGLGLSTCFGIVEDAGGSIRVESSVGGGSTFLVTLPLSSADLAEPRQLQTPAPMHTSAKEVLLCEDESGLRRVGVRALEGAGYRVHVAADGNEAIRLIDALGPRLAAVVSDMVLPGCGGAAVAAHAARVIPNVPVLLTSGYFDHTSAPASGASEILWKPLPPADLVRAVTTAIAKAGS
ncbi:MAG: hypothetical protein A3J29_22520 [Acidobacteria bacterium RIFCSPLOWO2_12_FULL_67_14b]|nr:MAG: hypothetical protein A3J29_22520 [Acidobacteria bacterium RIFCSPLOWO2_12_FULL_67_14b]